MTDTQPASTPAADDALSEHPALHTARRIWAAAYRDAADHANAHSVPAIRSFAHFLADRADSIGRGDFTPWADTPEPPTDDQLCDDPDCGCCYPGGMEEAQPTGEEVIRYAAFVADVIPAEYRAATQAVIHGMLRDGWQRPAVPAPDDQRRCSATDDRLGQCELYEGHLDRSDPADRHRTGSLLWADAAQRDAAPPLVSFAGAAPDLTGGMGAMEYVRQIRDEDAAEPAPEPPPMEAPISYQVSSRPFGGRCHHCYAVTSGPDVGEGCPDCGACGAEFTDGGGRGRHCGRNAGHEGGHAVADRPEPAPEPAGDGPGWDREAVEHMIWHGERGNTRMGGWHVRQIAAQLTALLADRDHQHDRRFALNQMLAEAWDQRDAARVELDELAANLTRTEQDLFRARAELATARRDAAADTWDDAARRIRRIWTKSVEPEQCARYFDAMARTTRTGARPVPGSLQPATDGGEESGDA